MNIPRIPAWLLAGITGLTALTHIQADLRISEVIAMVSPDDDGDNPEAFSDEDGDLSDIVEIHNDGAEQISLKGYTLTDTSNNLAKWKFSSNHRIDAGEYLVVYASKKNKTGLFASIPHTNFSLDRAGEYLALVDPDGVVIDSFDPLPKMYDKWSYSHEGYMESPTPGEANKPAMPLAPGKVNFSANSQTFAGELTVALSVNNLPEGAWIGYTTNGSVPKPSLFSPPKRYEAPFTVTETTQVRARVFMDGTVPGEIEAENYFLVNDELKDWSSNLPVIVIESFGARYTKARFSKSSILFLMPQNGAEGEEKRTSVIQEADIASRMNARQRGSSTGGWPKKSLAMEMWFDDADWSDKDIAPFGMPADGDWVLSGRYDFDRALIRNPLAYQISTEMGHWAPRTQFVEVFMNEDGGEVDAGDYVGVFTFMEKIELNPNRIDVQDPTGYDEGGFMVKVDRNSGQTGTRDTILRSSAGGGNTVWIEPEKELVTTAQNNWMSSHFDDIRAVIRDDDLAEDPEKGYRSMIDVESWIDESMVRMLARDPDAFRLSTYLYMPRNGKVHYGPVWDFDRTMGCDSDTRAKDHKSWTGDFGTYGWYNDLLGSGVRREGGLGNRPDFWQDWIDRYHRHRRTVLSTDNINSIIDDMAAQIAEGQARNFEKWTGQRPDRGNVKDFNDGVTGWEGEIVHLKGWLEARVDWIDKEFTPQPSITGGLFAAGDKVTVRTGGTLFAPQDAYYTTDGSDPRLPGGALNPEAIKVDTSTGIVATESAFITLRAPKDDSPWSSPIKTAIVVDGVPASKENLLISEIMYHPLDGGEAELAVGFHDERSFEFVELINVSDKTMFLGDLDFTDGITFPFSEADVQMLAPGERLVVVSDIEGFQARYGKEIKIAGEFVGQLANSGESLVLMRDEEVIQDFAYNDKAPWPETPDEFGFSLALSDPSPGTDLSDPAVWGVDAIVGGSPTTPSTIPPAILVNEVLANSGADAADAVELFNPTSEAVDVSGWFLTDDENVPNKHSLPAGTTIPAGGHLVVLQDNDNDPNNNDTLEPSSLATALA